MSVNPKGGPWVNTSDGPRVTTPLMLHAAGFNTGHNPAGPCPDCPHNWGWHVFAIDDGEPAGGTFECPLKDCSCASTWNRELGAGS